MTAEDEITSVLACAFLVAFGDADFSAEERESLSEHAGIVRRLLMARAAIERAEETGDLDAARVLFEVSTPVINHSEDIFWVGNYPDRLEYVGKARIEVMSVEELSALEIETAQSVESPFLQKLALFVAEQVASADGEFSGGERHTYGTMADAWGLSRHDVLDWYRVYAEPILTGLPPSEAQPLDAEETLAEKIAGFRQILNLDLGKETLDGLEAVLRPLLANPDLSADDHAALSDFLDELESAGSGCAVDTDEESDAVLPAHFKAIFAQDAEAIGECMRQGLYDNLTEYRGVNALSYAIIVKNLEAAALLIASGLDIDHVVRGRTSALICACASSFLQGVEFCLEAGAEVNNTISGNVQREDGSMGSLDNVTALHVAVNSGDVGIVKLLLAAGADPEAEDSIEMTPVDYAARRENEEMIDLLTQPHLGSRLP
jgi:hypothetical protein